MGRTITANATRNKYFLLEEKQHLRKSQRLAAKNKAGEGVNEQTPAVCFGPRQRKVKKSQTGEDGLCAVSQCPGAAEPRKPGTQVTEELWVTARWRKGAFNAQKCRIIKAELYKSVRFCPMLHK